MTISIVPTTYLLKSFKAYLKKQDSSYIKVIPIIYLLLARNVLPCTYYYCGPERTPDVLSYYSVIELWFFFLVGRLELCISHSYDTDTIYIATDVWRPQRGISPLTICQMFILFQTIFKFFHRLFAGLRIMTHES